MKIIPTKTPAIIKLLFPKYTWDFYSKNEKKLYLTFDDGPIPGITEFVLKQLQKYDAKATFFCIGDNIKKHPDIFKKVIANGHSIGNHTMNHLKASKNSTPIYIKNTVRCEEEIAKHLQQDLKLFRPPYGNLSRTKLTAIKDMGHEIILWDVLAKDWDNSITPEKCAKNVINHSRSGSIIVFHDSIKASKNLTVALPKVLDYFTKKGYLFDKI